MSRRRYRVVELKQIQRSEVEGDTELLELKEIQNSGVKGDTEE